MNVEFNINILLPFLSSALTTRTDVDNVLIVDDSVYSLQRILKSLTTLLIVIVTTSGATDMRVKLKTKLLILSGTISGIPYDVTSLSSVYPVSRNVMFHRRKFALVSHL